MIRTLVRKARTATRLPLFELGWFVPVWLVLGLARAVILVVPFRTLAPRLGVLLGASPWLPLLPAAQERRAILIGRVVRRAAKYTPWTSNCFPQAIAGRLLLGLYGLPYAFYFGVRRAEGGSELEAHAWVTSGRVQVTGGYSFNQFTTVGCFLAPSLAPVLRTAGAGPHPGRA
ncbi:lasso peptide biosynthesis B2 protein [Zavarzinia sp. CC-PAN008]|uniref:lasso peptide biosynthesis B2 protein n=1 Tax=Zavarzinia sp. CC-PAN008 TaxID=3243332 RepID=UPI003F744F22